MQINKKKKSKQVKRIHICYSNIDLIILKKRNVDFLFGIKFNIK
jgi:hypothetical protein